MQLTKVICGIIGLFSIYGHSFHHSDNEMRDMIKKFHDTIEHVDFSNPLRGFRCPHDKKSDNFKFSLIEDGYKDKLYSAKIRDELKAKRLYPVVVTERGRSYVAFICQFGCFALDTQILVIETIIKSKKGEEEELISFELDNGNTLNVTVNHGMVLSDGRVVSSQNIKEEDAFLDYDGKVVKIIKISKYQQNDGVINFRLKGSKIGSDHIMGAEGVLVGDHAWQTDMEDDLNGIAIRQAALN
jgi:hypothetical protein